MTERTFIILRYVDNVPAMASCAKCQLKFFTPRGPTTMTRFEAEHYLRKKFEEHHCEREELKRSKSRWQH